MKNNPFQQMKQAILDKLNASIYIDKSPKGFLDAPIVDLVNLINSHKDYVTTSSCSGRIVLFATLEKKWILAKHEKVDFEDVLNILKTYHQETDLTIHNKDAANFPILLKHEPLILHVQCSNLKSAEFLLQIALQAGYRESGIVLGKKKIMVAIRTMAGIMEVPLGQHFFGDGFIIDDVNNNNNNNYFLDFLRQLIEEACNRFDENAKRTNIFMNVLKTELFNKANNLTINNNTEDDNIILLHDNSALSYEFENEFLNMNRFKRWSHSTDSSIDNKFIITFGGYGIAKDGHVGRLNDFIFGYMDTKNKCLKWNVFDEIKSNTSSVIWPCARVRHTLSLLPPIVYQKKSTTTTTTSALSSYKLPCILFGGRSSPEKPFNEVYLGMFSMKNNKLLNYTILKTDMNGKKHLAVINYNNNNNNNNNNNTNKFDLKWDLLEMKSLKQEFPRKRWSHSASVLCCSTSSSLSQTSNNNTYLKYCDIINTNNDDIGETYTICIYGGRDNNNVFDDIFFLNVYHSSYTKDNDNDEDDSSTFGWWEPMTNKISGKSPGPRFSHTSTLIGHKHGNTSFSNKSMVIAGGYTSTNNANLAFANTSIYILNFDTMAWSSLFSSEATGATTLLSRYSHTASVLEDDKILLFGGIRHGGHNNMSVIDLKKKCIYNINDGNVESTLVRHTMSKLLIGTKEDGKKDLFAFVKIGGGSQVSSFGQAWNEPVLSMININKIMNYEPRHIIYEKNNRNIENISMNDVVLEKQIDISEASSHYGEMQKQNNNVIETNNISAIVVNPKNIKTVKVALEKIKGLDLNYRIGSANSCKELIDSNEKYTGMKLLPLTATCSDTLAKDYIISNITTNNNNNGNKVHNNNLNEYLGTKVHELFSENKCFFLYKKIPANIFPKTKVPRNIKKMQNKSIVNVLRRVLEKHGVKDIIPQLLALVPLKFEKLGHDVTVLPKEMFQGKKVEDNNSSDNRSVSWKESLSEKCLLEAYKKIASIQKTSRILCRYEIDTGIMRKSCANLLYDKNNLGSWLKIKENGVEYNFDCKQVMFCTGNGTEKRRMGSKGHGEIIVDLYAGIGYFTLPFLVHGNAKYVHACEINPDSVKALKKNLIANGVEDRCTVYLGDNIVSAKKLIGIANRVNLGLLPDSVKGYEIAVDCLNLNSGGILHVHGNCLSVEREKWGKQVEQDIFNIIQEKGGAIQESFQSVQCIHVERVKSYAPRVDHVVADIEIRCRQ